MGNVVGDRRDDRFGLDRRNLADCRRDDTDAPVPFALFGCERVQHHAKQAFARSIESARDYRDQQRSSAGGQFPAAVTVGCVDSRAPAEVIFDVGIGDMFCARLAGNVVSDDVLGSLEFACAVAEFSGARHLRNLRPP